MPYEYKKVGKPKGSSILKELRETMFNTVLILIFFFAPLIWFFQGCTWLYYGEMKPVNIRAVFRLINSEALSSCAWLRSPQEWVGIAEIANQIIDLNLGALFMVTGLLTLLLIPDGE